MSALPTFSLEIMEQSDGCFMARVIVSDEPGLIVKLYGKTEREARLRFNEYRAKRLKAHFKRLAGVEARREGKARQALNAVTGANSESEGVG